ncbi:MAG: L-glyceraldehyde 3-phosphate reductase [Armatimonadetes bacterium]|jgi:L-glyceraldehyde 3-phosphate reductase|nr:L-glyceraldehyde 3-phosphate reductase [Armatimonadota bacterium]
MLYRRCGRSGLLLPAVALGCGRNFGDTGDQDEIRRMLHRAFDLGITYFDLANHYGPPPGGAERNVGRILKEDFAAHRDELILSTKAGSPMWPGPYGDWGSKKYLIASLDQSLKRLGVEYVDIFYHHRPDPETPLEETLGALDQIVRQGKALYVGISNYSGAATCESERILRSLGTPLTVHQPDYSMLLRGVEQELLPHTERLGIGVVAYSPLARGLLSDRYLARVQVGDRVLGADGSLRARQVTPEMLAALHSLRDLARERGQTLAQMALAWVLRHPRVTTALIGASRVEHLDENLAALDAAPFTDAELQHIDAILAPYDETGI